MNKERVTKYSKIALLAAALFGFGLPNATPAKAEIAIGILTDLSGKASLLGRQIELGAQLAARIQNGNNGGNEIRLEVRDSACDPKHAQKAAVKLLRLNVKYVVGPLCPEAMYAAIKVLSPAGITVISPYIRASRISRGRKNDNWRAFTLAGNSSSESRAVAKILLNRWQGKAYAIADDGSIYGRGLADEFRTLAELSGQKPVALANYRPLQSKQISMLRRLQKSGMEALFIGGDAVDIAQIAKDADKIGMDIEIAGGESVMLLPYQDDAASIPDGVLAVMPVEPKRYPSAAGLVSSLKRQGLDIDGGIISGYALMQIAIAAGAADNSIEGQNFVTVLGEIQFQDDGFANAYPFQLHVWSDGQIKPLGGY